MEALVGRDDLGPPFSGDPGLPFSDDPGPPFSGGGPGLTARRGRRALQAKRAAAGGGPYSGCLKTGR